MEQFVLGIFQEHLAKYIMGFRKEQVNANLLNGKGEITDVSLNCAVVNDLISTITPLMELESVHVSRLSFNVSSWANIKRAPIQVFVEDVTIAIVEPLHYLDESKRLTMKQLTREEYVEQYVKGKKPRGAYNLFDRIGDNIEVSVRSINITFQTRGRFKTRRPGPWTPPQLVMTMRHFRYFSVDQDGNEASPDDCWRHNKFLGPKEHQTIFIYKKVSMYVKVGLQGVDQEERPPPLVKDGQVVAHVAFHKRVRDAAILAIQVDATMNHVEVEIDEAAVSQMAHAASGFESCFSKDRAFEDPLIGLHEKASETGLMEAAAATPHIETVEAEDDDDEGGVDSELPADVDAFLEDDNSTTFQSEAGSEAATSVSESLASMAEKRQPIKRDRPVLITPMGLVIHERVSFSLSVHDCTVRGIYPTKSNPNENGYVQIAVKGMIAELMWPKITAEKGLYVQLSLSYVSIQEKMGQRVRFLVIGGMHHEVNRFPVEAAAGPNREIPHDENFPLFEDRCLRPDPLRLRHTFPAQALGVKATIGYVDKASSPGVQDLFVLNELGVDNFDVVVDSDSWCRVLSFASNAENGGFDPRWSSGDWSSALTTDMLRHPAQALDLSEYTQDAQQMFLDENKMISSDLFNVTARISTISVRVPAAIHRDVRACDVSVKIGEVMIVISSALPRTFITGKIGSSIDGDEISDRSKIKFPNDPTDICYQLETVEDPLIRQHGNATSRAVSTFRCQLTLRGLSILLVPIVPFGNANKPQQLLAPLELTTIICFEGEPPASPEDNLMKLVLFISVQIYSLVFNLDVDLLSGSIQTGLYHGEVFMKTVRQILTTFHKPEPISVDETIIEADFLKTSTPKQRITSRKVLVTQQIKKSRETGGVSLSFCLQMAEFGVNFWRQNVPLNTRFRSSVTQSTDHSSEKAIIPLIQLMHFDLGQLEIGLEMTFQRDRSRVITKACLSSLNLDVCDFDRESKAFLSREREVKQTEKEETEEFPSQHDPSSDERYMVSVIMLGSLSQKDKDDVSIRVENRKHGSSRNMAISIDMASGGRASLHVHELEAFLLLGIESLLMPTGEYGPKSNQLRKFSFPSGSIGALLSDIFSKSLEDENVYADNVEAVPFEPLSLSREFNINHFLQEKVIEKLPGDAKTALCSMHIKEFILFVPHKTKDSWFGLTLHEATLLTWFLRNGSSDEILKTTAKKGKIWDELITSRELGLHHQLLARQSLSVAKRGDRGVGQLADDLIPLFELQGGCSPSDMSLSFGDSTLSVPDLTNVNLVYGSIREFVGRSSTTKERISSVLFAFQSSQNSSSQLLSTEVVKVQDAGRGERLALLNHQNEFLSVAKRLLREIEDAVNKHHLSNRSVLIQRNKMIDKLRIQVFQKERARLAALALVSHQATGWLRVGGEHLHGERIPSMSTLWQYHATLRKSLLLLYASPSDPTPLQVISLNGARLYPLAGGRRKLDVKTGFAIVEFSGRVFFMIAPSESDFGTWVTAIQNALNLYVVDSTSLQSLPGLDPMDISAQSEMPRGRPFSNELEEGQDVNSPPRIGTKMRSTFSSMGKSTRDRLGSAMNAARQRQRLNSSGEPLNAQNTTEGVDESVVGSVEGSSAIQPDAIELPTATTEPEKDQDQDESNTDSATMSESAIEYDREDERPEESLSTTTGRFGNLRAGARNRLGNTMMAAREKAQGAREKAASFAEQRRQRKEANGSDEPDTQKPRFGTGLRNRMSNAAANVKSRLDTSSHPPSEVTATESTLEDVPEVDALSSEPILSTPGPLSDDLSSAAPTNLDGEGTVTSKRGQFLSKLSGPRRTGEGRFSLRRARSGAPGDEGQPFTKLKGIRIGDGEVNVLMNDVNSFSPKLEILSGDWIVKVTCHDLKDIELDPFEVSEQVTNTDDILETGSLSSDAQESLPELADETQKVRYGFKVISSAVSFDSATGHDQKVMSKLRSFTDLLALYTYIAESISTIPSGVQTKSMPELRSAAFKMKEEVSESLGLSPLDCVRVTGHLLGGFLYADKKFHSVEAYRDYQAEVVTEFLNSMLTCPLPHESCSALSEFLGIETSIAELDTDQSNAAVADKSEMDSLTATPNDSSTQGILRSILACETQIDRAIKETQLSKAESLGQGSGIEQPEDLGVPVLNYTERSPTPVDRATSFDPYLEPLLPENVSGSLRDALHDALMSVMAERDEAQAQLIASSVIHVHEIEQERKNVEFLAERLKAAEDLTRELTESATSNEGRGVSGLLTNLGKRTVSSRDGGSSMPVASPKARSSQSKSERTFASLVNERVRNSDEELIGLCQQLSKEIAAKTSKSLEVIRLKESQKLERKQHEEEKAGLQEELRRVKQELLNLKEQAKG